VEDAKARGCRPMRIKDKDSSLKTSKKHIVQLMPRSMELERRRSKERRNDESGICKVWKKRYNYEKGIRTRKERDLMPRM